LALTIKIDYAVKITILPKSFWIFQKRTKINVQKGKIEKLLEKILYTIKIPSIFVKIIKSIMVRQKFERKNGHFLKR